MFAVKMNKSLRIKIIEAAGELFDKYGCKSVSMDDICGKLSISKKTIYQEVKDKKELVHDVVTNKHEEAKDHFIGILDQEENPIIATLKMGKFVLGNMLKTSQTMVFDVKKYYPESFQSIKDFKHKFIQSKVIGNLERGKKMGLFRKDMNCEIVASFYLSLYDEIIDPDYPANIDFSLEERFSQMLNYHLNGICTEKGKQELIKLKNYKELWPL
jgi:AcrR family transcriptional regulator